MLKFVTKLANYFCLTNLTLKCMKKLDIGKQKAGKKSVGHLRFPQICGGFCNQLLAQL